MLLTTETELRKYVSVGLALKIASLKPAIEDVEPKEIVPVLGKDLYNSLTAAYGDGKTPISADNKHAGLLPYVQRVIANMALADTLDVSQVTITESGITRVEKGDEKTAYHYQKLEAQQYLRRIAYNGLEDLLAYLEENLDTFPDWKSSEAYKATKRHFIQSAREFSRYYNINNSRLTFRALFYLMERAEQFQIREVVGEKLFDELKSQAEGEGMTADNQALLRYINPAVAYLTIADAALELSLVVTAQGLQISQTAPEINSGSETKSASASQMEVIRSRAEATGQRFLGELRKYLLREASPERYPLYYASELYPKPAPSTGPRDLPEQERTIYGAL